MRQISCSGGDKVQQEAKASAVLKGKLQKDIGREGRKSSVFIVFYRTCLDPTKDFHKWGGDTMISSKTPKCGLQGTRGPKE